MSAIIHHRSSITPRDRGVALLTVLLIVMAVAVISLGVLARSTTELACGQNMGLRVEMDQLAASGLEHARGLVLNPPQDIASEYWTGAVEQQLDTESQDFYDVEVHRDESDPHVRCNYTIESRAYRVSGADEVGGSLLSASLRLDPCIALWSDAAVRIAPGLTIHGDVRCAGTLTNSGTIEGDAFSAGLSGAIAGRANATDALSLDWPSLTVADFVGSMDYRVQDLYSGTLWSDLGPYEPAHVFHREGDLLIGNAVTVDGMLLVDGDLTVRGNHVTLRAAKNMPALFVTGDLLIEAVDDLAIEGLVVVEGDVHISAGASGIDILGAVFARGPLVETAPDSSGHHRDLVASGAPIWRTGGGVELDGIDDRFKGGSAASYLNGRDAITISLWVKSDVVGADRGILFTRDPTGNDEELGLRYDRTGARAGAHSCLKASIRTTSGYTQIESSSGVQTTSWQHLVLVWQSGERLKLYINGSANPLSYPGDPLSGRIAGVEKLLIGLGTKGAHWDGLLRDVRIYSQALSSLQVPLLTYGFFGFLPDPIAHWRFDEGGMDGHLAADPAKASVIAWSGGNQTHWSPAAGAFFKAISRETQ